MWTTTESLSQSAQMDYTKTFESTSKTLDRDFVETDTGVGLRKSTFLIDLSDWTKSTYTGLERLAHLNGLSSNKKSYLGKYDI